MIDIYAGKTYFPLTKAAVSYEMSMRTPGKSVVFVVPEVIKATVERIMFDSLIEEDPSLDEKTEFGSVAAGTTDLDVLSFTRLSVRILGLAGISSNSDDSLLRNVIYRVLTENPDDFPCLSRLSSQFEYIDMLCDLAGDFRRYGKTAGDLRKGGEESGKLYEMSLILERIDKLSEEYKLSINEDIIGKATELLHKAGVLPPDNPGRRYKELFAFKGSRIVITGFGNTRLLTPQELGLIDALNLFGADVSFYVASSESVNSEDAFFGNGDGTIGQLKSIGGEIHNLPFDPEIREEKTLKIVADSYARGDYKFVLQGEADKSVEMLSYYNTDDMIALMANTINRLTKSEEHIRFKDIRVLCASDSVADQIKNVFPVFGLQMFIDRRITLIDTPVVRYVLLLLNLSTRNYDINSVLRLLRTGVMVHGARRDLVDAFDNYCRRENITDGGRIFNGQLYSMRYTSAAGEDPGMNEDDFTKNPFPVYDDGEIYTDGAKYLYENIVKSVLEPLREVVDSIDKARTIKDKAKLLALHVGSLKQDVEFLRDEFLDRGDNDTALAIVRGYDEMMKLLSDLSLDINDAPIDSVRFMKLVNIQMKSKSTGSIPLSADSIEICKIDSAVYTPCKVLFIVGANSENFPHRPGRNGILSAGELEQVGMPDKQRVKTAQEFVQSAYLLTAVTDKLYYLQMQSDYPSTVLKFINRAITGDKDSYIKEDNFITPVYGSGVEARFKPEAAYITPEHVQKLFEGRSVMSVSSIEKFNTCHMQFMLQKAMGIDQRIDNTNYNSRDIGLLCHSMFEFAMKDVKDMLEDSSIDELIDNSGEYLERHTSEYFRRAVSERQITSPDKFMKSYCINPGLKVMRIFDKAYPIFLERIKESGFVPDSFELKLQDMDAKITPEGSGIDFKFMGSIDRVDKKNDEYMILDYKTGGKKFDFSHVYDGLQLQPLIYAHAINLQGMNVSDAGYINL